MKEWKRWFWIPEIGCATIVSRDLMELLLPSIARRGLHGSCITSFGFRLWGNISDWAGLDDALDARERNKPSLWWEVDSFSEGGASFKTRNVWWLKRIKKSAISLISTMTWGCSNSLFSRIQVFSKIVLCGFICLSLSHRNGECGTLAGPLSSWKTGLCHFNF